MKRVWKKIRIVLLSDLVNMNTITYLTSAALFSLVIFQTEAASKLPSTFQRCRLRDPKCDECLNEAIQKAIILIGNKGISSLGIPSIEPVFVDKLVIKGGGGAVQFDQFYSDVALSGLSTAVITNTHFDLESKILTFTMSSEDLTMKGHYEINGKLLVMPVVGSGNATISHLKTDLNIVINFQEQQKNGKTFFTVKSFNLYLKINGRVTYNFDNLFNGDKILSDALLQLANENWRELSNDTKGAVEETCSMVGIEYAKKIFNNVSIDQIFLED